MGMIDPAAVEHPKGVIGHRGDIVIGRQNVGRAGGPAVIVGDDPEAAGQGRNLRREISRRPPEARGQQHRHPVRRAVDLPKDRCSHRFPADIVSADLISADIFF